MDLDQCLDPFEKIYDPCGFSFGSPFGDDNEQSFDEDPFGDVDDFDDNDLNLGPHQPYDHCVQSPLFCDADLELHARDVSGEHNYDHLPYPEDISGGFFSSESSDSDEDLHNKLDIPSPNRVHTVATHSFKTPTQTFDTDSQNVTSDPLFAYTAGFYEDSRKIVLETEMQKGHHVNQENIFSLNMELAGGNVSQEDLELLESLAANYPPVESTSTGGMNCGGDPPSDDSDIEDRRGKPKRRPKKKKKKKKKKRTKLNRNLDDIMIHLSDHKQKGNVHESEIPEVYSGYFRGNRQFHRPGDFMRKRRFKLPQKAFIEKSMRGKKKSSVIRESYYTGIETLNVNNSPSVTQVRGKKKKKRKANSHAKNSCIRFMIPKEYSKNVCVARIEIWRTGDDSSSFRFMNKVMRSGASNVYNSHSDLNWIRMNARNFHEGFEYSGYCASEDDEFVGTSNAEVNVKKFRVGKCKKGDSLCPLDVHFVIKTSKVGRKGVFYLARVLLEVYDDTTPVKELEQYPPKTKPLFSLEMTNLYRRFGNKFEKVEKTVSGRKRKREVEKVSRKKRKVQKNGDTPYERKAGRPEQFNRNRERMERDCFLVMDVEDFNMKMLKVFNLIY